MLYLDYYGLKEKPFQETANPKFLWLGERHLQIHGAIKDRIVKNQGLTLLTGEIGTGKTVFLNCLAESLKPQVLVSRINNPDLDIPDFLISLSDSVRLGSSYQDKVTFLSQLILAGSNKKMILILVDEAHLLTESLLYELSLLLKIKKNEAGMVNIILAGQENLNGSLNKTDLAEILQVPVLKCQLPALMQEETKLYIRHRLAIAGATSNLFTVNALGKIHLFSGGIPRVINSVSDHALLTGYSNNLKIINSAVIQDSTRDFYFLNSDNGFKNDRIPVIAPPKPSPP
jgi:general secretion pathway protein A